MKKEKHNFKNEYSKLSKGKKRLLFEKFVECFGMSLRAFYSKLKGERPMRKPEIEFFKANL